MKTFLVLAVAVLSSCGFGNAAPLPTPEQFPKLAEEIREIGGKWPEARWFEPYSNVIIQNKILNRDTGRIMESRQLVLNLHEEWERNDITRYFQGLHYPGRPDSRRFPSSEDRDAWTTARFIMIHRGPSAGWFHEEREAAVHSPKDWRDVHLAGAVINFFNENILIQPGEAKSVAGKAVSMRKLKIFAMILRDLREEFKPDYEKRFPGWPSNDSGAFGGTEEERNAHRKMLEESRRKVEKAMVMRGWHASLAEVIRRGETSLCTGLRNNFSGNAVAIREILVCAGWKTPEQRADYWARMKKEGRSVQWSDADAAFLMPEPKESPPDTGH